MKRFLSFVLAVLLLASMLSGCRLLKYYNRHKILSSLPDADPGLTQDQTPVPTEHQEQIKIESEGFRLSKTSDLEFVLDQQMIDSFYSLLGEYEQVCVVQQDKDAALRLSDQLEEAYMALIDQYQIAYILYCEDQSNEEAMTRYLDCVDMLADMDAAYNGMCKRVYESGTPIRDELFADWTEQDIQMLLSYDEEIAQLEKRNSEITVEYRSLSDYWWEENMVRLYNEMVQNNNRIAQIYGYDNYYDYAYDVIYQRDYDSQSVEQLRKYVSKYMLDVTVTSGKRYRDCYNKQLSDTEKSLISTLVRSPFYDLDANYVKMYIRDVPESSGQKMGEMFTSQRAVFAQSPDAYEGAFTTMIGEEPYCFFGPGYHDTETVIHELGHFYGVSYTDFWRQPMDLSETQSRGNEWMFIHYMRDNMSPRAHQTLADYRMSADSRRILCFVMIDQFEQQVYSHPNAGTLTLEKYDAIMEQIALDYGGIEQIDEYITDIQAYWKRVVLESPVYYISYAVSGVAALELYTVAENDSDLAWQTYRKLMEEPVEGEGFLTNISAAGLRGPFDETVYAQIHSRYGK